MVVDNGKAEAVAGQTATQTQDVNTQTGEDAIQRRRRAHYQVPSDAPTWGLALSGGGIRSATFCLGVLQALAKARFSYSEPNAIDVAAPNTTEPLLARFDYLSSVSGGGYIGSFFSALFRPRQRDNDNKPLTRDAEQAARDAYASLQKDPPGRLDAKFPSKDITDNPVRWLRENGRYLTPNGPGDLLYDVAIALRNWLSVHYVAGITLITLFLAMLTARWVTVRGYTGLEWIHGIARLIEGRLQPPNYFEQGAIWASPWFVAAAIWAVLIVAPLGIAYWYRLDRAPKCWLSPAHPWIAAVLASAVSIGVLCFAYGSIEMAIARTAQDMAGHPKEIFLMLSALAVAVSLLFALAATLNSTGTSDYRSRITRWLTRGLTVLFIVLGLALVETGGQTLYLWVRNSQSAAPTVASMAAAIAALVTLIKSFAPALAQPGKEGMLSKIPLDALLAVMGILLLLLVLIFWHAFALYLFLGEGREATVTLLISGAHVDAMNLSFLLACLAATFAAGYFLTFINLSTLQPMYSARLKRAYLGASNRTRFNAEKNHTIPVTEPDVADDFKRADFYDDKNLGPAHLINVTINATTGGGDQLTQRDRQGIAMAITPDGIRVEGSLWDKPEMDELTIGQWLGISGAAFSTGIGRGTSLGKALVLALTNVRLGWWWNSGLSLDRCHTLFPLWRNQTYLLRELRASFNGTDGTHWYLTDGGHFENTAAYELLRRKIDVVVCCDCGADQKYEFEDLANLMRLARIDFQAEFEPLEASETNLFRARVKSLSQYIAANPAELASKPGVDNKCMLLYRVKYKDTHKETLLIVLKPRLIKDAPLDVVQYQAANESFPQQSTLDQFFDDAQWESYRKLGALIGSKLFPA